MQSFQHLTCTLSRQIIKLLNIVSWLSVYVFNGFFMFVVVSSLFYFILLSFSLSGYYILPFYHTHYNSLEGNLIPKVSAFWVAVSEKENKSSSNVSMKNNVANIGDVAKVVVNKKKKKSKCCSSHW